MRNYTDPDLAHHFPRRRATDRAERWIQRAIIGACLLILASIIIRLTLTP